MYYLQSNAVYVEQNVVFIFEIWLEKLLEIHFGK